MKIEEIINKKIIPSLGFQASGKPIYPNEGRIACNIIMKTEEKGDILFRCYPTDLGKEALGYGLEQAKFELEALVYLAERGAPTPAPLQFANGSYGMEEDGWFIFSYPVREGKTLRIEDLSLKVAEEAGDLLAKIIVLSEQYKPNGSEPNGDLTYIKTISNNFLSRRPDYKGKKIFRDLFKLLSNDFFAKALSETPRGLVHGDYFFENIIIKDQKLVFVIDFGDVYYGCILNDIVIGAMEFSMRDNEEWDMDFFEAFTNENRNWLCENNISFSLFHMTLLANCGRFIAHLYNLAQDTLDDNGTSEEPILDDENPYVQRFYTFQLLKTKSELERRYNLATKF